MTAPNANTAKLNTPKAKSSIVTHLNVRLRKIRSLKTSALQAPPPQIAVAAAKSAGAKPLAKSMVPYGLVAAALVLSGVTASEAHAAAAHTKKPAHVAAHVAAHVTRRHAVPVQQIDPVAQFFQGLFGGAPVVRTARGRVNAGEYVPADSPTYDTPTPVDVGADAEQAAANASAEAAQEEQNAVDQMNATIAADAAQAASDSQNTMQTEINAGM